MSEHFILISHLNLNPRFTISYALHNFVLLNSSPCEFNFFITATLSIHLPKSYQVFDVVVKDYWYFNQASLVQSFVFHFLFLVYFLVNYSVTEVFPVCVCATQDRRWHRLIQKLEEPHNHTCYEESS